MAARTSGSVPSKALTAWTELNERQQGTLAAIFGIEQAREKARGRGAARGDWDATPAALWRRIDFSLDPDNHRYRPEWTQLQYQLELAGWHNQGNGSTMAALEDRALITQDQYGTTSGWMRTVTLTRTGRAAARAGTTLRTGRTPKAALSARTWEVLALLWAADLRGEPLRWGSSSTIDKTLIGKHVPPLAAQLPGWGGYEITDRGRDFYREHYATHIAAHPDVKALHPDGGEADPWPRADEILTAHKRFYTALCKAWRQATADQQAATAEEDSVGGVVDAVLPADVAVLVTARRELWEQTAGQRAALAATHVVQIQDRAEHAARAYAAAALAAFKAATAGADPRPALAEMSDPAAPIDDWAEVRLAPPPVTGIHAIDAEAKKLHGQAVGAPVRRRGPAPKRRRARPAAPPEAPGNDLAALADFLRDHTAGGALNRRLHPLI